MKVNKGKWSKAEDQFLANTVIQYKANGRKQLDAFEEVAEELKRTSAACAYRWNATLRHDYREEIEKAKHHTNDFTEEEQSKEGNADDTTSDMSMKSNLQYLQYLEYLKYLDPNNGNAMENILAFAELKEENEQLKKQLAYFEQAYSHAFSSSDET